VHKSGDACRFKHHAAKELEPLAVIYRQSPAAFALHALSFLSFTQGTRLVGRRPGCGPRGLPEPSRFRNIAPGSREVPQGLTATSCFSGLVAPVAWRIFSRPSFSDVRSQTFSGRRRQAVSRWPTARELLACLGRAILPEAENRKRALNAVGVAGGAKDTRSRGTLVGHILPETRTEKPIWRSRDQWSGPLAT
jgi:hypothetical protein